MLFTPLGKIVIFCDSKKIEYSKVSIEYDKLCTDLDGRYIIKVKFNPDGKKHINFLNNPKIL